MRVVSRRRASPSWRTHPPSAPLAVIHVHTDARAARRRRSSVRAARTHARTHDLFSYLFIIGHRHHDPRTRTRIQNTHWGGRGLVIVRVRTAAWFLAPSLPLSTILLFSPQPALLFSLFLSCTCFPRALARASTSLLLLGSQLSYLLSTASSLTSFYTARVSAASFVLYLRGSMLARPRALVTTMILTCPCVRTYPNLPL